MTPGPAKSFDPEAALERARDLFWKRGYAATGVAELETVLGIGRKSLYDTFGGKRDLFLRALESYADGVIRRICDGLADPRFGAWENLERVLGKLARHHGEPGGSGCMLGVAMAQADAEDAELAAVLRSYLRRLEDAFADAITRGQGAGEIDAKVDARDAARGLVALTQGMALIGRVADGPAVPRAIVRAALYGLRRDARKPRGRRTS